ncbi:MAG: lysophospholipid acyltransferase family protein [Acidovorax sp.]
MRHLRACWRLLRLLGHVLHGLAVIVWRFPRLTPAQQQARVHAWAQGLLDCAGVTLEVRGAPPAGGPVLIVANHLSWLDIPVLHAARYCRFISKADVRAWPVVGRLATAGGTLYIERTSARDAMRVVHHMRDALQAGQVLAVFPEGTTGDGRTLLPFHANLLQAALSADAPVLPVGLRFIDRRTRAVSHAASYIGDETLVGSIWRTLAAPGLTAVLSWGVPEKAAGRDRRAWSMDLHAAVDALRNS